MRFFLPIMVCFTLTASAQPTFKAELSRNLTGETYFTIQYTVEGADKVTAFRPPSFRDLDVVKGPEQTQGYSLQNGELRPYVNFIYIVKPAKSGRIRLDDAIAIADGKTLRSGPVEIVSPGVPLRGNAQASPGDLDGYLLRKGEKVADKLRGNLFVRLRLSRTKCYVGEPIVAEYELYTRLNSESRVVKRPSFNGFSVFDMAPQESGAVLRETYNGKVYDVYPLRKVMMYPLQSGTLTLEALEVENLVSFVNPDVLGGSSLADALRAYGEGNAPAGAVVKEKITVSNPVQTVHVLELPEQGKPAGFNGAVGRFNITASLDKDQVEQGAVDYFNVTVSGQGNLPVLGKPSINWPAGVETFEDSIREEYNQFRDPAHWKKTFTVPFTSRNTGNVVIPAVRLVYFDPDSGHYRLASTDPIRLTVTKTTGVPKPVEHNGSFWNGQKDKYWIWLPIILVVGMIILFFVQRLREASRARAWEAVQRQEEEKKRAEIELMASAPKPFVPLDLSEMRSAAEMDDAHGFYRSMETGLLKWCRDNLGSDPVMGKEVCRAEWLRSGRTEMLWNELLALLRTAESTRFDPLLDSSGCAGLLQHLASLNDRLGGSADQSVNL